MSFPPFYPAAYPSAMDPVAIPLRTITEYGYTAIPEDPSTVTGNAVFDNSGLVWLEFTNTDTAPQQVRMKWDLVVRGQPVPAPVHILAAGQKKRIGPLSVPDYGLAIRFSATSAAVTVAAYQTART